jgi:hypothetical protein
MVGELRGAANARRVRRCGELAIVFQDERLAGATRF